MIFFGYDSRNEDETRSLLSILKLTVRKEKLNDSAQSHQEVTVKEDASYIIWKEDLQLSSVPKLEKWRKNARQNPKNRINRLMIATIFEFILA